MECAKRDPSFTLEGPDSVLIFEEASKMLIDNTTDRAIERAGRVFGFYLDFLDGFVTKWSDETTQLRAYDLADSAYVTVCDTFPEEELGKFDDIARDFEQTIATRALEYGASNVVGGAAADLMLYDPSDRVYRRLAVNLLKRLDQPDTLTEDPLATSVAQRLQITLAA